MIPFKVSFLKCKPRNEWVNFSVSQILVGKILLSIRLEDEQLQMRVNIAMELRKYISCIMLDEDVRPCVEMLLMFLCVSFRHRRVNVPIKI